MLGLAQRAGKLISGEELVIKAVQSGQARLVFLANDAGSNVTKKTTDKCNYYNIEVSTVFNALELSMAIGKPRKTVAVSRCWIFKENEDSYGIKNRRTSRVKETII